MTEGYAALPTVANRSAGDMEQRIHLCGLVGMQVDLYGLRQPRHHNSVAPVDQIRLSRSSATDALP